MESPTGTRETFEIVVTNAKTGQPIEDASVRLRKLRFNKAGKTDAGGRFRVEAPSGGQEYPLVTVDKDGFVPMQVHKRQAKDERNDKPIEIRFELEPGTTIGGKITDEAGKPIAEADVFLLVPAEIDGVPHARIWDYRVKTDQDGAWHADNMPSKLTDVWIRLRHPQFVSDNVYNTTPRPPMEKLRDGTGVMSMAKGESITGRVLDKAGKPIHGARVAQGRDRFGSNYPRTATDTEGKFEFTAVQAGEVVLTVQAEGYAPDLQTVQVEKGTPATVDFALEPGRVMRGKVVDAEGRTVSGAFVAADTWRGKRSLEWRVDSDAAGRFEWKSAPADVVLIDCGKQGYMSSRHVQAIAGDGEVTITLQRPFVLSGQVRDAETGRPVPSFEVIRGNIWNPGQKPYWERQRTTTGRDGQFSVTCTEERARVVFRVEAPGYAPAVSPEFSTKDGSQVFNFDVKPAPGFEGVVLDAQNKPVAGAEVALVFGAQDLQLSDAGLGTDHPKTETDAEGCFRFNPQDEPCLVVAASEKGYAEAEVSDPTKSLQLQLAPWARISGRLQIGDRSAGEMVLLNRDQKKKQGRAMVQVYRQSKTDAGGDFFFDRLPPLSYSLALGEAHGQFTMHVRTVRVNATAGGAITANIGGNGRPVTGRITTADGGELENANPTSASLVQRVPAKDRGDGNGAEQKTAAAQTIALNIGEDGRFRVEEVSPGPYTLTAQIFSKTGQMLGRVEQEVVVPEIAGGRTSEVLELPPIALVPFDDLDVGEEAPEIVAVQVTGEPFKLSDLRGRFVLLDFWATWCGPCIAEMPTLKSVHEKYEDRDDFLVVSMSVDAERKTAADFIKRQKLDWTQVFLGDWSSSPYPTKYGVFGIPAIFLIGPDGRVLAKNLRDEKLKEEVAKALDAVAAKDGGEPKKEP